MVRREKTHTTTSAVPMPTFSEPQYGSAGKHHLRRVCWVCQTVHGEMEDSKARLKRKDPEEALDSNSTSSRKGYRKRDWQGCHHPAWPMPWSDRV